MAQKIRQVYKWLGNRNASKPAISQIGNKLTEQLLAHVNANISSARFNSYRQGNRRTWMRNMMLNLGTKQMSQNMLIDVPCTLNVWLWFTEFLSNQQR